ncbi:hypothetical protein LC048_16310 [Mesobacillus subterraneus]|uniref:HEAT repeat domain-containing protein n=1 Tax=Mesobacillus subterraneus TaxID=285983 RepID=UPI001CFE2010|nr:hypothetical protein [Mesobacillus subterraneus]WLR54045.1 hypothetical protein LC048_16310 [Mesobacillus subterraneus]
MIKNEIQFLVTVFTLLSGMLLIMLIYLIIRKAAESRLRKRVEDHKNSMNDKLLHCILTGDILRSLQADTKAKKLAIEQLLSKYAEILEGNEEKNNLKNLAEMLLSDHYRIGMKSNKWSTRMNALFFIETFKIENIKEDVVAMMKRRWITKEEKIKAMTILAQIQYNEIFQLLTEDYKNLSHLEYRNILSRLNDRGFEQFLLGYNSCHTELKFTVLDLIGLKKDLNYLLFAETVFSSSRGEERIRSLKALVSIGFVRNLDNYLPLLKSVNWEERMLAARLAGVMKVEHALPDLVQLLQDPSWWVRSQAGQSIITFPHGKEILQGVLVESTDAFAKDMAWEWINKGVYQT